MNANLCWRKSFLEKCAHPRFHSLNCFSFLNLTFLHASCCVLNLGSLSLLKICHGSGSTQNQTISIISVLLLIKNACNMIATQLNCYDEEICCWTFSIAISEFFALRRSFCGVDSLVGRRNMPFSAQVNTCFASLTFGTLYRNKFFMRVVCFLAEFQKSCELSRSIDSNSLIKLFARRVENCSTTTSLTFSLKMQILWNLLLAYVVA